MAFDEILAERIRNELSSRKVAYTEKRMMGGLCFMVMGKMCLGVVGSRIMVRLDPLLYEASLKRTGCKPMDFTGRPMKGFVFIEPPGHKTTTQLSYWIDLALDYNPKAKSSKTRNQKKKAR